ncbi:hypothetical protein CBR_g34185 [Chara braunii]|uniref:Ubiquitin-like protein ATG12 n=1 Tax=Chara braunii TaxID=69332 RepID=A0A388LIE3_CHABU|nr:hypothetical protein CBR_g34185 [Chara braunii]|eukprot:GBG82005.1 hypothetical protein CBR_g34185 [Chara braunii]
MLVDALLTVHCPFESFSSLCGSLVVVLFKATGDAPILKQNKFKIGASEKFVKVIEFLRKQLHRETLFLYINSAFSPNPDELVGDLFDNFGIDGKLVFLKAAGWRGRRRSRGTILAFHPYKVGGLEVLDGELGGVERGSVEVVIEGGLSGVVMEKEEAGGSGRGLVMGVEESIVVKHAREEVSKGHVGFVGEGGGKIFVAYSLDAGDERKVGNDGGGNEKFGPLEEGVTWSSRGSAVADFSHPPFGGIADEAGGGNGEPVGKGHVVEVKRVLELGKEEENVLVGEAGEGHDFVGSEGTGDFLVAVNDLREGVEAEVIGGDVVAGVVDLVVVLKEVVGGELWHCGVNPRGGLGIGGTGGGDGGGGHDGLGEGLRVRGGERGDMDGRGMRRCAGCAE